MNTSNAERLMSELAADPEAFYNRGSANELRFEFGLGYPLAKLRELINDTNVFTARVGIWIASELGPAGGAFLDDAILALQNPDFYVRFYALDVISFGARDGHKGEFVHIVHGLDDDHSSVRWKAMTLLARSSYSRITALIDTLESTDSSLHLRWLPELRQPDPATIEAMIASEDGLTRKYGAVGAARLFDVRPDLLELAASSVDDEIKTFAIDELRHRRLVASARARNERRRQEKTTRK